MIRCPITCIVHVWRYSRRNDAIERDQIQRGDRAQPAKIADRDVSIDHDLGQVRRRQIESRVPDDGGHCQCDLTAVRPQVREQPPHQAAVVGTAEDVVVDHDAFSSSSSNCLR